MKNSKPFSQVLDAVAERSKDPCVFCPSVHSQPDYFLSEGGSNRIEHHPLSMEETVMIGSFAFKIMTPRMITGVMNRDQTVPFPLDTYGLN